MKPNVWLFFSGVYEEQCIFGNIGVTFVVVVHSYPFFSPNERDSWIYLILLEISTAPNLIIELSFASLSFCPTFLLCSTTACVYVSYVCTIPLSILLKNIMTFSECCLILSQYMSIPSEAIWFCQLIFCSNHVQHLHLVFCRHFVH